LREKERESIEAEIEAIHATAEILFELVSKRIGELLRESGKRLQGEMQEMRRDSASRSKAVAAVEVVKLPHKHGSMSKKSRKAHAAKKTLNPKRKKITMAQHHAKQKIYQARYEARKAGLPESEWPKLPVQEAAIQ